MADRAPWHGPDVQFSNFSLIEDRETRDLEMYLTTFGQESIASEWATADAWRYVVTVVEPGGPAGPRRK